MESVAPPHIATAANGTAKPSAATLSRPPLRFPQAKHFVLAGLVLGVVVAAFFGDSSVDHFVRGHWNRGWIRVAGMVSKYGDLGYLLLVALIIFVLGGIFRHRMATKLAIALVLSSCLAGVVTTTIRSVTGRTRPSANVAQGWYGIRHDSRWLVGKYQFNSFPSGHTGCAVGFAIPLFLGFRRGRILAVVFAAAVGWSRIYLGCHHLSDVIVAALIGIVVGLYAWHRLLPKLFRG